MILMFSHKPSLALQPFTCQFPLNMKKFITSRGSHTFATEKFWKMSWIIAKIRRHPNRLCDGDTFCTRDNSIFSELSTSILPKALHIAHWRHLSFHMITNLKYRFAAMFIYIAYHHYVVNIHFEWVQSSLESCTTSKLADRFTSTSYQMKWHSSSHLHDVTCDTTSIVVNCHNL
jgi:hypothetical protein